MREKNQLEGMIGNYNRLDAEAKNNLELAEMAEAEKDAGMVTEAEKNLGLIAEELHNLETDSLLSGEADHYDCFLEINSGAGGTESQDWASMLMHMYLPRIFPCLKDAHLLTPLRVIRLVVAHILKRSRGD